MTDTKPTLDEFAEEQNTESTESPSADPAEQFDGVDDAHDDSDQLHQTTGRVAVEHADDVDTRIEVQALIETIESEPTADQGEKMWTSDMRLPSFGELLEGCGDDIQQMCCDCGHVSTTGEVCNRSTCPRCFKNWDRLYTTRLIHKIEQIRRIRQDNRSKHQRCHHVVISPPADWEPDVDEGEEWKALKRVVDGIAEVADLDGFAFYHPYSGRGEDDLDKWKDRIGPDTEWEEVYEELMFRPHMHFVCVGHKVPGGGLTRALEAETDWVIHRITKKDSNVSLYGPHDLARAVSYCLSHVGLYETKETTQSAVRGIGDKVGGPNPSVQIYDWDDYDEDDPEAPSMDQIREDQKLLDNCDAISRRVAPTTLDLAYDDVACQAELSMRELIQNDNHVAQQKVNIGQAEASKSDGVSEPDDWNLDATAAPSESSGDDLDLESAMGAGQAGELDPEVVAKYGDEDAIERFVRLRDDLFRDDMQALVESETETCEGRTVVIAKAPTYLNDDEWVANAEYAEELREAFIEWSKNSDWGPDPDALDDYGE